MQLHGEDAGYPGGVLADRKSFFPNISMSRGNTETAADEERAEAMKPSPKSRTISAASMPLR